MPVKENIWLICLTERQTVSDYSKRMPVEAVPTDYPLKSDKQVIDASAIGV